jgi:H+/Cl- antiporter ClcA
MARRDYERRYLELKAYTEEVVKQLNEIRRGHIHIESLRIKYDIPQEAISYHHWRNRIYIFIGASFIGVAAVFFARLSDASMALFQKVYDFNPLIPFALTPFGLLLVRWLTKRVFPGSEGSGIPQAIACTIGGDKEKLLGFRAGIGKVIGTNLALLCGGSVGREGPTVQVGAIISRFFFKILKAPVHYSERSFILAGSAAGVSAAFNTPIAGIVFAIEELAKSFYERETSVLMMSIVVSGLCALAISGPYFYFGETQVGLSGWAQLYAIPIGLFSGLAGGFFSLFLVKGSAWMEGLSRRNAYLMTFVMGLMIAAIGYLSHGTTFGTGYAEAKSILGGTAHSDHYSLYKFAATVLSYLCGVPGGIFSPTLSVGAGIGHWFLLLFQTDHVQAFVLLGMATFFSGVIRSPITATIVVSEMTHNQRMLLPLLMGALVAYGVSRLVTKEPLYHVLAHRYPHSPPTPEEAPPPAPSSTL